jgi:hypothetical protein
MSYEIARKAYYLSNISRFSAAVLKMPLYDYQVRPLTAVLDSVLQRRGREFLLVFSRQSGKNEAVAHLLVYLLNIYRREGGNMVFAATGDGLGRGQRRLQARLNNPWNRHQWRKASRPARTLLGQAAVTFISSHPQAAARGETADHLLVVDELQDQDPLHLEAVFTPMRAASNATAVYLGTVRSRHDALWRKKETLQELEAADKIQRVFWAGPELVERANPLYGRFLEAQVDRYGRYHPIIASEYFLEPLDGGGGLFPPRRLALMRGRHARLRLPRPEAVYVALLDVGGQDEAATTAFSQLANPARDYTVCTIIQVLPASGSGESVYHAVDVFVDQGSRFFDSENGSASLAGRLLAYLNAWSILHLVADATGVGEGLVDWLSLRLGRHCVTPFKFTRLSKAALGAAFLALVETGRFKYWVDDRDEVGSDGWWFWQQAQRCLYELPPGGLLQRDLRWYVPESARVSIPLGCMPVHDDRLISAALVAEIDRLLKERKLLLGDAISAVLPGADPLDKLEF